MSVFKKKNALASTEFCGFDGMDSSSVFGKSTSAREIVNFKILNDNSLKKRSGFKFLLDFPDVPRAVWSGMIQGEKYIYAVCSNSVYRIDDSTHTATILTGTLSTLEGKVNIAFYGGILYALDGEKIFSISIKDNTVTEIEGYVPLIGKDWPTNNIGEEYESPNAATRHVRISYVIPSSPSIYLRTKYDVETIDAVFINGERITDSERYYYDPVIRSACVIGLKEYDEVLLYLTLKSDSVDDRKLLSCKQSAIYGGLTDCRLFLWDGVQNNLMFGSRSTSNNAVEENRVIYPLSSSLYFPTDASIEIGQGDSEIRGISRQYDRMLIFTSKDCWMSSSAELSYEHPQAMTINYSYGCASKNAICLCENEPVCVSDNTILRFTADTDQLSECNAYSISYPIDSLLGESFYKSATVIFDSKSSELLFTSNTDGYDTVWVYNIRKKAWYCFSGIDADSFIKLGYDIGFIKGRSLYVFLDDLKQDILHDGTKREIRAHIDSQLLDFGISGRRKRLCGFQLVGTFDGGEIKASLIEHNSDRQLADVCYTGGDDTMLYESRLNSHRFDYLSLRLEADGACRQHIQSCSIWVKS